MCLNLYDYQFKASRYSYRSTYLNSMVTTNQKLKIESQKFKERNPSTLQKKIIKPQKENRKKKK